MHLGPLNPKANTILKFKSQRWKTAAVFGRPCYRSSFWYTVSSVCRLSVVVCNVFYCGKTVRPS